MFENTPLALVWHIPEPGTEKGLDHCLFIPALCLPVWKLSEGAGCWLRLKALTLSVPGPSRDRLPGAGGPGTGAHCCSHSAGQSRGAVRVRVHVCDVGVHLCVVPVCPCGCVRSGLCVPMYMPVSLCLDMSGLYACAYVSVHVSVCVPACTGHEPSFALSSCDPQGGLILGHSPPRAAVRMTSPQVIIILCE